MAYKLLEQLTDSIQSLYQLHHPAGFGTVVLSWLNKQGEGMS
jgi:hypothetical protein